MIKKLAVIIIASLLLSGCTPNREKTVINFSTWGSATELTIIKQIIKDFETENPNIKIQLQHIPQNYFKKLHLLFASSTEPDVILINNQNLPTYAKYLLTLTDFNTTDFYPNAVKALSYKNELKAVPRDISTLVVYYNKTLVTPKSTWSLGDLLNDGKRLQKSGIYAIALEPDIFYLYPFLMAHGETPEAITEDNLLEQEGAKFFKSLSDSYHYAPQQHELGMSTPAEFFLSQRSAYYLSGRWMYPKLQETAKFPWGVIEFPSGKSGNNVPCDATGWAISVRSKHIEASKHFVSYLAGDNSLNIMSSTGLIIPAKHKLNPQNSYVFIKPAQNSKPIAYPSKYDKIKDKLNQILKIESR